MFCPNCGKDCGSAKFCPECGNNLSETTVVRSGEGDTLMMPPIGIYKGLWCSLELTKDSVILSRSDLLDGTTLTVIPYCEIRYVTHMQTTARQLCGFLSIRTRQDTDPLITNFWYAEKDKMSATFNWTQEDAFLMIFRFLSDYASRNRAYWLDQKRNSLPSEILKRAQTKYELTYYKQYYPDKQKAILAIQTDTGLDDASAQMVIDHVFDVFRNEIFACYEENFECVGRVKCPNCGSLRIASRERGTEIRGAYSGLRISSAVDRYHEARDKRKEQCICMKCGYTWYQE